MKQFKCSMSKKKESLGKKNEDNSKEYITEWQADIIKGLEKVKDKYGLVIEYNGPFSDEWKEYPTYSVFVRKGGKKEDIGTVGTDYVHAFVDYTSPGMNVSGPHKAKDYSAEEAIQVILNSAKMCLGKKGESHKKSEATKFIDSKIDALVKEISDKYGFTLQEKTKPGWETSWYLASGNTFGHMTAGKIAIWINGFRPNGEFLNLGYKVGKGDASSVGKDIRTFDTLKKNLLADCDKYFGAGASESKKNERGTTKIETYVGFDELLGYADAEYLLEDVVDVLSKYYTYEDDTFDEGQAKGDPEFTIKIEGGDERADFYSEDIFYVHLPNKEAAEELAQVLDGELSESKKPESKKSEGISDMIDAKIDYNMFMRMCKTAAYLEEDEDYWDALWEYYSEVGSIGDALVFFDNLFQYTAWKDVEETYDELKDEYKDESKSKEECIEKAIDDGALDGVYPYGDHYLWIY